LRGESAETKVPKAEYALEQLPPHPSPPPNKPLHVMAAGLTRLNMFLGEMGPTGIIL